jgi:hypothetical protein
MDGKNLIIMAALWSILVQPGQAEPGQAESTSTEPTPIKPPLTIPMPTKPALTIPAQGKNTPNVLDEIYKFSNHTLCPIICNPPLLFPPILCKIREVKERCLKQCPGVTYMSGKKTIDLTECKAALDQPFTKVAVATVDRFCFLACNRVTCSNFNIPIPTPEGVVKFSWPGKEFGNTICKVLCKKEKIKNCLKAAEEYGFEALKPGEFVELP